MAAWVYVLNVYTPEHFAGHCLSTLKKAETFDIDMVLSECETTRELVFPVDFLNTFN